MPTKKSRKKSSSKNISSKKKASSEALDSKSRVLEAYIDCVVEHGIFQVSLKLVSQKANVSQASINYYFGASSQDLVVSACLHCMESGYRFMDDFFWNERQKKDFHPLEAYVKANIAWIKSERRYASFFPLIFHIATLDSVKESFPLAQVLDKACMRVHSLLNESIGMGLMKSMTSKKEKSELFHRLVVGACLSLAPPRQSSEHKRVEELMLKGMKEIFS